MASGGLVNLNEIIEVLEKDAQTLSTIVDICTIINDIPVAGANIEKTKETAVLLKDLSTNGFVPIIEAIDALTALEIDNEKIAGLDTVISGMNENAISLSGTLTESADAFTQVGGVLTNINQVLTETAAPLEESVAQMKNTSSLIDNVISSVTNMSKLLDKKNNNLAMGPIKLFFAKVKIKKTFNTLRVLLGVILDEMTKLDADVAGIDVAALDKSMANIANIMKKITSVIDGVVYFVDPKKNKLAMNPLKLWVAKYKVKQTFKTLKSFLMIILSEMATFSQEVASLDTAAIDESMVGITNILKKIKDVIEGINFCLDPEKNKLAVNPIKLFFAKRKIKTIFKAITEVLKLLIAKMEGLKGTVDSFDPKLTEVVEKIAQLLGALKSIMKDICKMALLVLPFVLAAIVVIVSMPILCGVIYAIVGIMQLIAGMDVESLSQSVNGIKTLINDIKDIFKAIIFLSLFLILAVPVMIMGIIAGIFVIIELLIFVVELNIMIAVLSMISKKDLAEAKSTIWTIMKIFLLLAGLMVMIVVMAIFMEDVLAASITFILGVAVILLITLALIYAFKFIAKAASKLNVKDLLTIIGVFGVILIIMVIMLVVAAILLVIQQIASKLQVGTIILFILGLLAFAVVMGLLGLGCAAIGTYLLPAAAAIILVFVTIMILVGVILITAVMLFLLQKIELDFDKIKENVLLIMSTCKTIVESLFGPEDETEPEESDKGFIQVIFESLGGGIAMILQALLAVAYLALMMVAILLILLIAVMLRLLQELDLDTNKIMQNVGIVMDTAQAVIDSIFDPKDDKKDDASSKGFFASLLEYLGTGILKILQAIMAVAYLALILVAILLIDFIAAELRILQEIELNESKITENIGIVMDTAQSVIDAVFDPGDDKGDNPSNKGFFYDLLNFCCPALAKIFGAILSIAYLALILVAILLVDFIAAELLILQKITLNEEKIRENVGIVMDTAQMVVDCIFDPEDDKEDKPTSKGFFMAILDFFCPALAKIFGAIMSIAYLALIIVAIMLIVGIAKELEYLQEIVLDEELIRTNVQTVIDTANMVTSSIFDPVDDKEDNPSSKGFFLSLLELFCKPLADIFEAIMAIAYLALIIVAINLICEIARQLEYIAQLQIDEETIKSNVQKVVSAAKCVINAIFQKDNTKPEEGKGIFRKLLKMILPSRLLEFLDAIMAIGYLSLIKTCVGLVGEIAQNLTAIMKLPSMNGISDKVGVVISTARTVINAVLYGGKPGKKEMKRLGEAAEEAEGYLYRVQRLPNLLGELIRRFEDLKEMGKETEDKAVAVITSLTNIVNQFDKMSSGALNKANQSNKVLSSITKTVRDINRVQVNEAQIKNIKALMLNIIRFGNTIKKILIPPAVTEGLRRALSNVTDFTNAIKKGLSKIKLALPMIQKMTIVYGRFFRLLASLKIDMGAVVGIKKTMSIILAMTRKVHEAKISRSLLNNLKTLFNVYGIFFRRLNSIKIDQTLADGIKATFDNILDFTNQLQGNPVSIKFIAQTDLLLFTYYKFFRAMKDINLSEAINKEALQTLTDGTKVMKKFTNYIIVYQDALSNSLDTLDEVFRKYCKLFATIDKIGIDKAKAATVRSVLKSMMTFTEMANSDGITNSEKLLQNYDKFLTKVDDVELKNLKTATKMFGQMARFSESINGNFDALADTLNDKIAPLMEELKELLTDVQERVAEKAEQPSEMEAEKNAIRDDMKANGQARYLTEKEVEQRVDNKYQENVQQRYGIDEVASKLTQLINLFQSGDAIVKTT